MRPAARQGGAPASRPALGAWSFALVTWVLAAAGVPASAQDPADAPGAWFNLAIPGGTGALLSAAGLDPARPRTTVFLDLVRLAHEVRPGTLAEVDERRERLLTYLDTLEAKVPDGRSDEVPLPAPESAWRTLTAHNRRYSRVLAGAILSDRQASLLYFGLCSMDDETRRYLAARLSLLQQIYASDRAALIALYGRALHVRAGVIDPPGGPASAPLWEAIAGEPLAQPDRFILAVLGKDKGRLALLYDAVAHMEPRGQAYALGSWIDDADRRLSRFRALYSACGKGLSHWQPAARPFARGLYDPAHVLLVARASPDGRPGPLGWRSFWKRALESDQLPAAPRAELANLEQGGVLDAAALLETIFSNSESLRRDVAEAWCFGQRVFGEAAKDALPDVLVAIRGYSRYRSLDLTLERLGVTDPSVYSAALGRAERIARMRDADRAATALALYQGALVLIERARLARTLDPSAASRLVASLARLPTSDDGDFGGSVASWIDTEYLPALGAGAAPDGSSAPAAETAVLAAFAGCRRDRPSDRAIDFEGMRYRIDPSSGELARIEAVREKQGGVSLDAALALAREAKHLAGGVDSVTGIPPRLASLGRAAAPVLQQQPQSAAGPDRGIAVRDALKEAARALEDIRKTRDLRKLPGIAEGLTRTADRVLGEVLAAVAYAAALPDPDSTALLGGDPSLVHDWGLRRADQAARSRSAWAIPEESHEANRRWHVHGSLLALDVGMAEQALRRLSSDAPPGPPTVSEEDRRGFTEAAVLSNALDYRDEEMALLAAAIRRGRGRVAALAADPAQLPAVAADAGLDEARHAWLSWAVVHERDRVATFFSLGDLLRLGRRAGSALAAPDAWGASGAAYDGRLSLRFPASQPFATLAGRRIRGLMSSLVPDLPLLVAEALDDRRLPAVLTRAVLLVATPDYLDRLALAYDDDWLTLVADVQRIVPGRMDDYLASVTTGGPLVLLAASTEGKRP